MVAKQLVAMRISLYHQQWASDDVLLKKEEEWINEIIIEDWIREKGHLKQLIIHLGNKVIRVNTFEFNKAIAILAQ